MTVSNVHSLRPTRRLANLRVCTLGLAIGLMATAGIANAAQSAPITQAGAVQSQSGLAVTHVDFRRGDDGAGRLVLRFDGNGAAPDLRNLGSSVVVDIGKAHLPASLQRSLNVVDFATPVQRIDPVTTGDGTRLVLSTQGNFESLAYQTGNEYVVEIVPRADQRAVGSSAVATTAAASAAAGGRQFSGRPVTFNFQDVPVRTVLQLIAEESNLNVVASDTVQGNVTLRLVNVPWDQALSIVLRAKGLDQRRDGNVIWVAPQPELAQFEQSKEDARRAIDDRVELITEYIQINYHSASAIFKAITEAKGIDNSGSGGGGGGGRNSDQENGFLSQRGRIVADERTNTLMISDIPRKVAQMRELIAVIDRPVDQVLIEGRIVIATDTFARDLGARFGVGYHNTKLDGTQDTIGSGVSAPGLPASRGLNVNLPAGGFIDGNPASLAYTLLKQNFNLDIELSALQEEGRGEVISNPRIVTTNQREGVIRQGREVGYVTMTGGTGGQALPSVQFKEALLELKVTPTITDDNRVFLVLNVKKDEILGYIDTDIGMVPELAKREINTAVLVNDGQTVVIGGVYEFIDRSSVSKVPFLGDVPFLGNLFKKRGREKDKAELLIFVTPKVLRVAPAAR